MHIPCIWYSLHPVAPPAHRVLFLHNQDSVNQVQGAGQCAPLSVQQRTAMIAYYGPVTCTSIPWTLAFGGCSFNGDHAGAPLVRSGSCPTQAGTLDLSSKGITSVPPEAFANMTKMAWVPWTRRASLLEHEWHLEMILHVPYIISVFDLILHGVCLRIYAFNFGCLRIYAFYFFYVVCGSHWVVCFVLVWEYTYISLHGWRMHSGVGVLHLQNRHVSRRFHMKCVLAIRRNTLNAYSLHLHIYDRCGVCARLTWLFLEVRTHLYSTDTLTRAHTHWRTRKGAATAKERKPDCFLLPPHRTLGLSGNQLSSLPDTVFDGLSALT
jgi:hypothetical protein